MTGDHASPQLESDALQAAEGRREDVFPTFVERDCTSYNELMRMTATGFR